MPPPARSHRTARRPHGPRARLGLRAVRAAPRRARRRLSEDFVCELEAQASPRQQQPVRPSAGLAGLSYPSLPQWLVDLASQDSRLVAAGLSPRFGAIAPDAATG